MDFPKAKFIEELYSEEEVNRMVKEFQENGYTILRNVFERESVKEFKAQLQELMFFNGISYTLPDDSLHYFYPALAPRGRQFLPQLLSHSIAKPMPSVHTTIIVIETDDTRGSYAPQWHKDRQPDGMPGKEYHYPQDVFLGYYFEDIDEDHGPTQIIPGSHRDVTLNPYNGAPVESIYLNMEDALMLDQRTWHRGVSRKAPGTRFLIVYGIYAMPHYYGTTFQMPRIQRDLWMKTANIKDRIYFGGPFAPPDIEALNEMLKLHENGDVPVCQFPKMT
jgi:hypothetical protein